MVMTDTGGATISTMVGNYYDKVFLERLEANLVYDKNGVQKPLPANSGGTVMWHMLLNPAKGTSLSEGVTMGASAVSTRRVSATPVQYADLKAISDLVDATAVCPVVEETVKALGYAAALTKDWMISDAIGFGAAASTGVADATSTKVPSVNTQGFPILEGNLNSVIWTSRTGMLNGMYSTATTIAHIRKAVTYLKSLNAQPFEDGNFRAVVDPLISDQIRADSAFATWMAYTNRSAMEKGKLGVIEKVLFEESTQAIRVPVLASTWSTTAHVSGGSLYGTLIHGKGAYGVTKVSGIDAKVNVISGADKTDPLNQYTYVGYKLTMAAKILNPSCGIILTYYMNNQ